MKCRFVAQITLIDFGHDGLQACCYYLISSSRRRERLRHQSHLAEILDFVSRCRYWFRLQLRHFVYVIEIAHVLEI